ncbi:hypothetical protein C1A50_0207 [Paenibacillus polymyxa]|nr:hypothetical protein C1A50_0207 [Paenibacillus polymyxa]
MRYFQCTFLKLIWRRGLISERTMDRIESFLAQNKSSYYDLERPLP